MTHGREQSDRKIDKRVKKMTALPDDIATKKRRNWLRMPPTCHRRNDSVFFSCVGVPRQLE